MMVIQKVKRKTDPFQENPGKRATPIAKIYKFSHFQLTNCKFVGLNVRCCLFSCLNLKSKRLFSFLTVCNIPRDIEHINLTILPFFLSFNV